VGSFGLSVEQPDYVWSRWRAGESLRAVAAVVSPRRRASVTEFVKSTGGVRRPVPRRRAGHLSVLEREEISRGIAAGEGVRGLARRLGRSASTVSREISRNGGVRHYRAVRAEAAARARVGPPKPAKLAVAPVLRAVVEDQLGQGWSPQQISARLVMDFPHDPGMRVLRRDDASMYVKRQLPMSLRSWCWWASGRVRGRCTASGIDGSRGGSCPLAFAAGRRRGSVGSCGSGSGRWYGWRG